MIFQINVLQIKVSYRKYKRTLNNIYKKLGSIYLLTIGFKLEEIELDMVLDH